MSTAEKIALIEDILMRAADQIGDITPAAMAAYYQRNPDAKAAFEANGLGKREQLEGMMIENSLHCLMNWFQSPGEIEILLGGSVLHHHATLNVPTNWYSDLIETTAEVIAQTIPADNVAELSVWNEVRRDLHGVIDDCRKVIEHQGKH